MGLHSDLVLVVGAWLGVVTPNASHRSALATAVSDGQGERTQDSGLHAGFPTGMGSVARPQAWTWDTCLCLSGSDGPRVLLSPFTT